MLKFLSPIFYLATVEKATRQIFKAIKIIKSIHNKEMEDYSNYLKNCSRKNSNKIRLKIDGK
jgi:hypothetical protein